MKKQRELTFKQKLLYRDKALQKAISRILADFYISVGEYDKERFNKNLKKYTAKMYEVIKFLEVVI